jgi:hypothetical protein
MTSEILDIPEGEDIRSALRSKSDGKQDLKSFMKSTEKYLKKQDSNINLSNICIII